MPTDCKKTNQKIPSRIRIKVLISPDGDNASCCETGWLEFAKLSLKKNARGSKPIMWGDRESTIQLPVPALSLFPGN